MKRGPETVREQWQRVFFAVAACSWMPHWACHYYRLETNSSFVVGSWEFTRIDSAASLLIYSALIALNLIAIGRIGYRPAAAIVSGILHLSIGSLHAYRLIKPFRFEVFDHAWPLTASLREVLVVVPFGLLCLWMARHK
jgi:hypothetical protein